MEEKKQDGKPVADDSDLWGGVGLGILSFLGRKSLIAGVGAATVISGAYFFRRSRSVQVAVMKYKLRGWKTKDKQLKNDMLLRRKKRTLQVNVDRDAELRVLEHHFCESKPSIAFISGPISSGRSWLTSQALRKVNHVLKIDLHKEQVSGATELLEHLVRKTGYYYPTTVLADLGFVQPVERDSKKINRKEIELALSYLEVALMEIVEETQTFPCIFIDELHSLKESSLKSNDFTRFLQWAMHISDTGLANVVLVGRDTSLLTLDQEHQSVRQRRVHFPIDYPQVTPDSIKFALRHADDGKVFDGAEEAKILCQTFGGHLRDIEKAIDFADNGLSIQSAVSRMVTETCHFILSSCLEPLLAEIQEEKNKEPALLAQAYKKYLRCWRMLVLFSEKDNPIVHDELLYEVFNEHGHEIEKFVSMGLIRYCWPPLGSNISHEITLKPTSPRIHAAFKVVVNKPGMKEVALEIQKHLARLNLAEEELRLSLRVNTLLSIQRVLGRQRQSSEAAELESNMSAIWKKLHQNWEDFDSYEKK